MEDGVPSTFSHEASDHLLPPSHKVRDALGTILFRLLTSIYIFLLKGLSFLAMLCGKENNCSNFSYR